MSQYDDLRKNYLPSKVKVLFIAGSPPPAANVQSSRHFYRSEKIRKDDRLFTNTIKALYPAAAELTEAEVQKDKKEWLRRFQADGFYMIEALEESQVHEVTKKDRQLLINIALPQLIESVKELAEPNTKIILIKSNVFEVTAQPLQAAGFNVLNKELVDYPGRFNQPAYRQKISQLLAKSDL